MRRRPVSLVLVGLIAAGAAAHTAGAQTGDPADDHGAAAAGCPVTETRVATWKGTTGRYPNGKPAPRVPEPGWVIQQGLWLNLGENATIIGRPLESGAIRVVSPWWRERRARPAVLRTRIRAIPAPGRGSAHNENDKPIRRTVRTTFLFPHEGCWRIDAKSANARFSMVVWVVVADEPPAPQV